MALQWAMIDGWEFAIPSDGPASTTGNDQEGDCYV